MQYEVEAQSAHLIVELGVLNLRVDHLVIPLSFINY